MEKSKKNSSSSQGARLEMSPVEVEMAAPPYIIKPSCCHPSHKCWTKFLKILFVVLAVLTILKAICVIAVTISTAIATQVYNQDQSARLGVLIVVAVSAAIALAICIYAVVAVFTKNNRPIHVACIVLLGLALIQAIMSGAAMSVSENDQSNLGKALADSFRLAAEHSPRHLKMWATTQNSLQCCGMYGPDDYRPFNVPPYFPPDVPISCCPSYDLNRSDLVQERDRELCKAKKEFHELGCKNMVVGLYVESAILAQAVVIGMIILEVITGIIGGFLYKKRMDALKLENEGHLEANI